jgi:hypothetical protein
MGGTAIEQKYLGLERVSTVIKRWVLCSRKMRAYWSSTRRPTHIRALIIGGAHR